MLKAPRRYSQYFVSEGFVFAPIVEHTAFEHRNGLWQCLIRFFHHSGAARDGLIDERLRIINLSSPKKAT